MNVNSSGDALWDLRVVVYMKEMLSLLGENPKDIATYLMGSHMSYGRHEKCSDTPSPPLARNRPSPDENLRALMQDLCPSSLLHFQLSYFSGSEHGLATKEIQV